MRKCIAILLLSGVGLHAQNFASRTKRLFSLSFAAVASASMADTATSWGKFETNPVLGRSRFGMSQAGIKIGVLSAALAGQYILIRHHRSHVESTLTVFNFASAGVLGAVAYHNSTVPRISGSAASK